MGDSDGFVDLQPDLPCKAYLLFDQETRRAAIVDPRFDRVPEYLKALKTRGLELAYCIDTHTHADHLSGADRFRNLTGCKIVMSEATKSRIPDLKVADGQTLSLGSLELRLIHTPGHTPDCLSVHAGNRLFTGDSLFIGGSARCDFMGGSPLAQFDSFRKIEALGEQTEIWPGHDYNGRHQSTVGEELRTNEAFSERDRDRLVRKLSIKAALPENMAEMLSFNTEAGLSEERILRPEDCKKLGAPGVDLTFLDLRFDDELAAGRIDAPLTRIPLPELKERWDDLKGLPRPVVSVCRSGVRATLAMMAARHAGDEDWYLLEGGMLAWQAAGLPLSCDTDLAPEVIVSALSDGGTCAAG